ncbi:AMP-binding protein [Streptomyces sp. TX20-6-3]|uniref:AMP-binding protein n=1 Tax=Streptomyces sp. TX20-6-3 TaxID=3028705 RepID=UPI0029AB8C08|nr:AMP-binding protein [Streptomyces sp. TX20-6-3]MDX2565288.1 AMP-binding protein [Streptomyces sp. TX20-6-3]
MISHLWELFSEKCKNGHLYQPALKGEKQDLSLQELLERAEDTARHVLEKMHDRTPRRLGILMSNGEPWVRGFMASTRLGATVVPLPLPVAFSGPDAYVSHISRICKQANLDAILVDRSLGRHFTSRIKTAVMGRPLIDIIDVPVTGGVLPDPGAPDDLAVIQYTSGSTSAPKGVALTHRNVTHGLETLTSSMGWREDDAYGVWVPLFHDMGLFNLLASLSRGASVCLWKPADAVRRPMQWLTEFAESPATALSAPNFFYDLLCSAAADGIPAGLDLSSWHIAANGAESIQHRTMSLFGKTFAPFGLKESALRPSYGMAEATLLVSTKKPSESWRSLSVDRKTLSPGDRACVTPGTAGREVVSCGVAGSSMEIRIASQAGSACPDLTVGEIEINGPSVTHGYLDLPSDQQPFTPDGWLRTGDVGFLCKSELYVTGRIKSMITLRGQNFYAEDVEEIVRSTPGAANRRAAAITWGDGLREEIVVLLEKSASTESTEIVAAARGRIIDQLGLQAVRIVTVPAQTIPHTSSGKVQRVAARQLYESIYHPATGEEL